jgi:hypothetical protein
MDNTWNMENEGNGKRQNVVLMQRALRNTLDVLGGEEQKEMLLRFLDTQYGISVDGQNGFANQSLAKAFSDLFGSAASLLIARFNEEIATLQSQQNAKPSKNSSGQSTDLENSL